MFFEILPAAQFAPDIKLLLCNPFLLKWSHESFLFLHSLELAMAKLGGGVEELKVNLLQGLLRTWREQTLASWFPAHSLSA